MLYAVCTCSSLEVWVKTYSKPDGWENNTAASPAMDREVIIDYLETAEENVTRVEQRIARQCEIVTGRERDGQDSSNATWLLRELLEVQATIVAYRDRLRAQLGN